MRREQPFYLPSSKKSRSNPIPAHPAVQLANLQ
jgi:hypothetical protein